MTVNFFTAQLLFWKRIFDYKGVSGKKEYFFPLITTVIISLVDIAVILISFLTLLGGKGSFLLVFHHLFAVLGWIITIGLAISVIPWISLTVRRLRDGGKSGWWTILILAIGIGHLLLAIICMTASTGVGFISSLNEIGSVYGPPIQYSPSNNVPDAVYGPPEDFDPTINMAEPEYGPPEMYEPNTNINNEVYGPPEMFE